jgi:hypothetical protein
MSRIMQVCLALVVPCVVALSGGVAAADKATRESIEFLLKDDVYRLANERVEELQLYGQCRELLKRAKKKLKPTDKLRHSSFEIHPKAVKDGDAWTITVADIPWICDAIDLLIERGTLAKWLKYGEDYEKQLATNPELNSDPNVRIGAGDDYIKGAKACRDGVAKEVAAGATEISWQGKKYAIADAERLCDVLVKWGEYMNASGAANFEKIAPKYRELGVDGDRLKLFVEYDGVYFRGKGCEIITDIKKLVKAKYVYHWLENSDYTHTIRKYTFKGNKYKVSEKTYTTEAKAYKGCK